MSDEIETLSENIPDKKVNIRGKDGKVRTHTIREMEGSDLARWLRMSSARDKRNSQGVVVKKDFDGMHAELISMCLFDASGKQVGKATIDGWGASIKNRLYEMCLQHNGLTVKADVDLGKDSDEAPPTTGGTGSPEKEASLLRSA